MLIRWARHALMAVIGCVAMAAGAGTDPAFQSAVQSYRAGRWADAYGAFVRLASEGDADAARIALFMHRNGPILFGAYWDASAQDVSDWQRLADLKPGRPDPAFKPLTYERTRATPRRSGMQDRTRAP